MKTHDMHDGELLKEYVERDSQAAFATLVERYMNLVYSVCLREVRNADLAHDVTQVVFLLLVKKAPTLRSEQTLAGWLYKTARFASKDALKQERRRQYREQKAGEEFMHLAQYEDRELTWAEIEPTLYTALDSLGHEDREAVLLRFFQKHSLKEVGANLGISEDAARMKVSRAVEKLRRHFKRHGFIISGATLTALISANAVQAAPATCLAAALSLGGGLAGGAAISAAGTAATGSAAAASGVHTLVAKSAVHTLFEGVSRAMLISQVKVATVIVVGSAAVGTGVTKAVRHVQKGAPKATEVISQTPRRDIVAKSAPRPALMLLAKPVVLVQTPVKTSEPSKTPEPIKTQPKIVAAKIVAKRKVVKPPVTPPAQSAKPEIVSVPAKPAVSATVESMVPRPEARVTSPVTSVNLPLPALPAEPAAPKVEAPSAVQTVTFEGREVPVPQFAVPEAPKIAAQPEAPKEATELPKIAETPPEAAAKPEAKNPPRRNGASIIFDLLSQLSRAPIFNKPRSSFNQPPNRAPMYGGPMPGFGAPRNQFPQRGFGSPPNFGRERERDR